MGAVHCEDGTGLKEMSNANSRIFWDNGILPSFILHRHWPRGCGPQVVRGRHGKSRALHVVAKSMIMLFGCARRSKVVFQGVHRPSDGDPRGLGEGVGMGMGIGLQSVLIRITLDLPGAGLYTRIGLWTRSSL